MVFSSGTTSDDGLFNTVPTLNKELQLSDKSTFEVCENFLTF